MSYPFNPAYTCLTFQDAAAITGVSIAQLNNAVIRGEGLVKVVNAGMTFLTRRSLYYWARNYRDVTIPYDPLPNPFHRILAIIEVPKDLRVHMGTTNGSGMIRPMCLALVEMNEDGMTKTLVTPVDLDGCPMMLDKEFLGLEWDRPASMGV